MFPEAMPGQLKRGAIDEKYITVRTQERETGSAPGASGDPRVGREDEERGIPVLVR